MKTWPYSLWKARPILSWEKLPIAIKAAYLNVDLQGNRSWARSESLFKKPNVSLAALRGLDREKIRMCKTLFLCGHCFD